MNEEIIGSTTDLLAMVFGFVVFAPLAETLVMTAVFAIFAIMRIPLTLRIPLTAGIAGALHALIALPWAATTTWLFFIFSVVYITQQRRSESRAFAMTTGVHALNNAVPAAAMLMAGTLS
ncbi:MAG: hypothetical protein HRU11_06405 [Parvularculaceae bacterium]|nr:hypothetical protein [Parvularculaceae bacterium]